MREYKIATEKIPMGLNNKICEHPVYWCKIHEIWLSEEDIKFKKCKCKTTFDLLGTVSCNSLVKKEFIPK